VTVAYLDTSAFVKTVVREPESSRLLQWLDAWPDQASCALLRTEAIRAVRPSGQDALARARASLRTIRLVRLNDQLLDDAGELAGDIRSLDAIHIAAAQSLGQDLGALVTYDVRMQSIARELGLPVVAP
jgi:uncharacterized protein